MKRKMTLGVMCIMLFHSHINTYAYYLKEQNFEKNYSILKSDKEKPILEATLSATSAGQPFIEISARDTNGGSGIRKVEIDENTDSEKTFRVGKNNSTIDAVFYPKETRSYNIRAYDYKNNYIEKNISVNIPQGMVLPEIDVYQESFDNSSNTAVVKVNSWKESTGKNLSHITNPDGTRVFPSDPSRPYSIKYTYNVENGNVYNFEVEDINGIKNSDQITINEDVYSPNLKVYIAKNLDNYYIDVNAWDGDYESGIERVEVSDGTIFRIPNNDTYSINEIFNPIENGEYTFTAYDRKGNSTSKNITFSDAPSEKYFPIININQQEAKTLDLELISSSNKGLYKIIYPDGSSQHFSDGTLKKEVKYNLNNYESQEFILYDNSGYSSNVTFVPTNYDDIESKVAKAEESKSVEDIKIAREAVNLLPESMEKDLFQDRLNAILTNITLDRKSASSNVDVYIKSENTLILSLSTNSIVFEDFSGVNDMEKQNAVELTVSSSLPYEINTYLPNEITGTSGAIMDKNILEIKANGQSVYQKFTSLNTPIRLLDNQSLGNGNVHGIDLNLKGSIAHAKDNYKATIKFEVNQK